MSREEINKCCNCRKRFNGLKKKRSELYSLTYYYYLYYLYYLYLVTIYLLLQLCDEGDRSLGSAPSAICSAPDWNRRFDVRECLHYRRSVRREHRTWSIVCIRRKIKLYRILKILLQILWNMILSKLTYVPQFMDKNIHHITKNLIYMKYRSMQWLEESYK